MRAPFPSKEASWERLSARIGADEHVSQKSLRPLWIGIAASIALAVGFFSIFSSSEVALATQLAEHQVHVLPDGSTVTLNADTRLSYDENSFDEDRTLTLDGEAFFEVKKGSSFKVSTDQGTVTVLGTSFNVCDRAQFFEVTCVTGKVAVDDGQQQIVLTPGLATNNKTGGITEAFAETGTDAWRTGAYFYVADDLAFVLEEVERQFGVDLKMPDLSGRLFTGEFNSEDIETTLTLICGPMGLDYSMDEETRVITIK